MHRRGLVAFTLVAFGLAWVFCLLPLWLIEGGLEHGSARLLVPLMMLTPSVGVLVALRVDPEPESLRAATGMRLGEPGWGWYWAFGWLGIPALCVAAPFVGAALGLYDLDLEFSGFRQYVVEAGGEQAFEQISVESMVALQLGTILIAPLLNAPFAFGEELGWRGYLLPRLLPLGQVRALGVSGVIWGVWHAPIILLGHNYPSAPVLGTFMMIVFCVLIGILLGWTRLVTGSVWPAVIGHAALNGSAGVIVLFHTAGYEPDSTVVGITGWSGWILPLLLVVYLFASRRLPVRSPA